MTFKKSFEADQMNSCNAIAMADGGSATLVYGYIFCWIGALVTAASLAEMASM
jgi:hypothetical protein